MKHFARAALRTVLIFAAMSAAAQTTPLTSLSVDDLLNVEVTSVARHGQKLSETTAATFVITQEDIRRSGATSIPDLLRIVPGFDVAQVNANIWAVSARGFNGRAANKVLVLIDGRSAYSQVFFGVDWNTIDFLLDDIDRIEVTRGPGGTLWGANAMNGVINIVTKHPVDTQGTLANVSHGIADGPSVAARFGGRFGNTGSYRAYLKTFDRPATHDALHASFNDQWSMFRGGFRAEWATRFGALNVQGDFYNGKASETTTLPNAEFPFGHSRPFQSDLLGHNVMLRWTATQSPHSETSLQASYDATRSNSAVSNEKRENIDLDFQHHLLIGSRHDGTWGVELRRTSFQSNPDGIIRLQRTHDADTIATAFVQDEISITPKVRVTAGTKVVNDPISGLQWQPTLRALWLPTANQSVWGAITHAVRFPSQLERFSDSDIAAFPSADGEPINVVLVGNRNLSPESETSYEIGYRVHPARALAFDVTAYTNSLSGIVHYHQQPPAVDTTGRVIIPLTFEDDLRGRTSGVEALMTLRVNTRWDLYLSHSVWSHRIADEDFEDLEAPHHQTHLRSFLTLSPRLEFDTSICYIGSMTGRSVPHYLRVDARMAWQATPHLELSVVGKNLTSREHIEFNGLIESQALAPVKRAVIGMMTWRY